MSDATRRPLTDLVFLRHGPPLLRAVTVTAVAVAAGLAGSEIVHLQDHFAARLQAGAPVTSIGTLLGRGSSPASAVAGWVAALLFGLAVLRLRRGQLEPSAGIRPVEAQSVRDLRRGLRREYLAIRMALAIVLIIAAIDAARVISIAVLLRRGDHLLSGSFASTVAEAAGLATAALMLAAWASTFAHRLEELGLL